MTLNNKTILITGGTGSFGKKYTEIVLSKYNPKKIIIFSRDEYKQHLMRQKFPEERFNSIRYFIGDVRDKDRLYRAFDGVDYVIHAAALKHVNVAEYNPFEAVHTNIIGTQNVIDAAIDKGVRAVVSLSTDKAVSPVNLYGATKLCLEKITTAANVYSANRTRFSVVRYGNVVGSRGSVIPLFIKLKETGKLPITDYRMTRFWIDLEKAVELVLFALENARGGEIFVPKIPSMNIVDLAEAIAPGCEKNYVGIRPGEKLHELLLSADESRHAVDIGDKYVILSEYLENRNWSGNKVEDNFEYSSDKNQQILNLGHLKEMLANLEVED